MEFLEIILNCLQIFGIFIRFLDFSIRFLFEISAKVYEIFLSDTPLVSMYALTWPLQVKHSSLNLLGILCSMW